MADEADVTTARQEREEEILRRLRERREAVAAEYHKTCVWCGDDTENGAKFCSKDCSADWHKHDHTLKRVGLRR